MGENVLLEVASSVAGIIALSAFERLLAAMNQLVHFQAAELTGRVVALVAVVFLFQISSILDVEIFCPFYSWIFHVLTLSSPYRKRV